MGVILGQAAPRDVGERRRTHCEWWGGPLAVEGAASPEATSMGLPHGKPLVGTWYRGKHLLNRWCLLQKWGRVETPEAVELVLHEMEIEDCLEALSGCVVAGLCDVCFSRYWKCY